MRAAALAPGNAALRFLGHTVARGGGVEAVAALVWEVIAQRFGWRDVLDRLEPGVASSVSTGRPGGRMLACSGRSQARRCLMRTDSGAPVDSGRRRLLAMLGLGGVTGLLGAESARGGHDGTNVLHLGQGNSVPAGSKTGVGSDVEAFSFDIDNFNTGLAGALSAVVVP